MKDSDPASLDVNALLERMPLSGMQIRVLLLATLAIVLEGFDIQLVAFAAPSILSEWSVTGSSLGVVMASSLVGMAVGAALGGYFGDRVGRRATLIGSTALFSVTTLAAVFARDVTDLTALRAIAGIGFGAALPCATALVAEYMPARIRAQSIAILVVGVPLGGMLGAAVASMLVPAFGWRSVFLLGGTVPLLLTLLMVAALPESLRFLLKNSQRRQAALKLLGQLSGRALSATTRIILAEESSSKKAERATIFRRELARSNMGLWLAFLASLACAYAFFSWIPTALSALSLPLEMAIRGSFFFNLFGVLGALGGAWLVTRLGSRTVLVILLSIGFFAMTALTLWLMHLGNQGLQVQPAQIMTALSLAGLSNAGAQAALYALAAHVYPTACRVTGIGMAASVGRAGAIASAYGGGLVLSAGSGATTFFLTIAILLALTAVGSIMVDRHIKPIQRT
jgi:AAHS family 4-hydroxybenzoate transporter-like MFS transporter